MRAAPPVTVQCTGGLAWRLMRAGLPALAVASLCAWALGHSGQSAAWALLAVPAVIALHLFRRRLPQVRVAGLFLWDPQRLAARAGRKRARLLQTASLWLEVLAAVLVAWGGVVATRLPADAVLITVWQSGSVRFHAGRDAVLWDSLDPAWLDRAVV